MYQSIGTSICIYIYVNNLFCFVFLFAVFKLTLIREVCFVFLGCTSSNPRTLKKSMSQNGDPKMAISIGIYSIEEPDVGFWEGGSIYIYIYIYIWYPPPQLSTLSGGG